MKNYIMLSDQKNHNLAVIPLVLNNDFNLVEGSDPFVPVTKDSRLSEIPYIETVTHAKQILPS